LALTRCAFCSDLISIDYYQQLDHPSEGLLFCLIFPLKKSGKGKIIFVISVGSSEAGERTLMHFATCIAKLGPSANFKV
jgi:hypothetical protein